MTSSSSLQLDKHQLKHNVEQSLMTVTQNQSKSYSIYERVVHVLILVLGLVAILCVGLSFNCLGLHQRICMGFAIASITLALILYIVFKMIKAEHVLVTNVHLDEDKFAQKFGFDSKQQGVILDKLDTIVQNTCNQEQFDAIKNLVKKQDPNGAEALDQGFSKILENNNKAHTKLFDTVKSWFQSGANMLYDSTMLTKNRMAVRTRELIPERGDIKIISQKDDTSTRYDPETGKEEFFNRRQITCIDSEGKLVVYIEEARELVEDYNEEKYASYSRDKGVRV